jgi:hypothetical protein
MIAASPMTTANAAAMYTNHCQNCFSLDGR